MPKPLNPKSEPIDPDPSSPKTAKVYRGMKVRACDGPYRGHNFRFYPSYRDQLHPFGGEFETTLALDSHGMVDVYRLERCDDQRKWGLWHDPIASEHRQQAKEEQDGTV